LKQLLKPVSRSLYNNRHHRTVSARNWLDFGSEFHLRLGASFVNEQDQANHPILYVRQDALAQHAEPKELGL
jgi:hypothetical protein